MRKKQKPKRVSSVVLNAIASVFHDAWRTWSKTVASKENLSAERLSMWKKSWIPYNELPEDAKEKDRRWARKVIMATRIGGKRKIGETAKPRHPASTERNGP